MISPKTRGVKSFFAYCLCEKPFFVQISGRLFEQVLPMCAGSCFVPGPVWFSGTFWSPSEQTQKKSVKKRRGDRGRGCPESPFRFWLTV